MKFKMSMALTALIGLASVSYGRGAEDDEVGALKIGREKVCTAFLVGPNEIMTAAHCFDKRFPYTFESARGAALVESVAELNQDADTIRLKLKDSELFISHILLAEEASETDTKAVAIAGNEYIDGESFSDEENGLLYHGFKVGPGDSGSPIIKDGKVIAMHLGQTEDTNLAVPVYGSPYVLDQNYLPHVRIPFEQLIKVGTQATTTFFNALAEQAAKDLIAAKRGQPPEPKAMGTVGKPRIARKVIVNARGSQKVVNASPHVIVSISAVSGLWQCCSATPKVMYLGYRDGNPHPKNPTSLKTNDDYPYMCLLCDAVSSTGVPVICGMDLPGNTQLILWPNDNAKQGLGDLEVTVLVEKKTV